MAISDVDTLPQTLPDLLIARASSSNEARITFLDADGNPSRTLSYQELYDDASILARRLIASGLTRSNIILSSFPDHQSHIRLFWACCLSGIPFCPLPALHPDPTRQAMLFNHLQTLFHQPTLISRSDTIQAVHALVPEFLAKTLDDLTEGTDDLSGIFPARVPSSDDTVCFMLTSGSTGNSKAVQLRHSNLLSSIRGKKRHHGTSSNSRFLNWIAFDHVACVSESHLQALEVNASQWHIAPSAIIRNPRALLELTSSLKITYTFSPNFLIAHLLSDVSNTPIDQLDLSSLRAFISGGESVPMTTAIAFADLLERFGAPRDTLRAGFGMSETGAGSIYDTRPIPERLAPDQPTYLSLGKCCPGIEMRIVDLTTGNVVPARQVGHLQIKGPTVFRGYYGNARATKDSFTEDGWFITGDLANLDDEGNLFMVGRDNDSININGVKYLPQDVVRYIEDAKVEGVVYAHIYVCPMRLDNADTETYGVFYQHDIAVEDALDATQRRAINATNRMIKNLCTVFCSQGPHVVLPLPRASFVRTALGKVSQAQLVKAFLQGNYKGIQDTLELQEPTLNDANSVSDLVTPVEQIVAEAVASVFSTINPTLLRRSDNIFDLGASSMHLLRLKHVLQDRLSLPDIPTIDMLKRPEIGALCDYLAEMVLRGDSVLPVEYQPLVCFNSSGTKPPLFMVHPGVGEVLVFVNLARVLSDDRPVYALRARGFDNGDTTFDTFDDMTQCYTEAIEKACPNGPYYLAGYSFGAAVAFEIGKVLEAKGKQVAFIGILNLPPVIRFRMLELSWSEVLLNIGMFLSLITPSALDPLRKQLVKDFPEMQLLDTLPSDPVGPIEWLFKQSNQKRLEELDLNLDAFVRWVTVAYNINRTGRTFEPKGRVIGALTTVFCAIPLPSMGTREEYKRDRLSAWAGFSGKRFEMVDVDGEHYTMLSDEHVVSFASHLRAALGRAEASLPYPAPVAPTLKKDFEAVPIIDFSLSKTNPGAYLDQLKFALEDVGFGVFVNVPGFEDGFQKEIFAQAQQLFSKPQEWKDRLGTANSPALRGYFRGDSGSHKAYAEAIRFGAERPAPGALDDPDVPFWLKLHEGPNQWPDERDLPGFRKNMEILFERYRLLNLDLNKHICELLDITNATLDDFFPNNIEFNSAIWHYFPVTPEIVAEAKNGFVTGMHEHRDPSTFVTCLIQNRPGLQVQNHRGNWVDIPLVEGGVVCNIGMQLMKLTGGKLVATTHRVNTLKIDKDRFTIPYVLTTKLERPVIPLPQFSSPDSAKSHVIPNPKIQKLMSIEDPLIRSGYARLTLFPAATQKLYPKEFAQAEEMGIV